MTRAAYYTTLNNMCFKSRSYTISSIMAVNTNIHVAYIILYRQSGTLMHSAKQRQFVPLSPLTLNLISTIGNCLHSWTIENYLPAASAT